LFYLTPKEVSPVTKQILTKQLSMKKPSMKQLLMKQVLIACLTFAASAAPAAFAQQTPAAATEKAPAFKAHVLSRPEVDALRKQPDKVLFIDVRRPDEVTAKGGFPVYLSIQIDALESNLAWIPKDRQIVTVSNHAARAGKAADILAAKGYRVAGAVGVELYEKDGGTLTKIAIPPSANSTSAAIATTATPGERTPTAKP
jgi:rhodanese-related sulfurtransferase